MTAGSVDGTSPIVVIEEVDDAAVRIVRLNRPEARNAMDPASADALTAAFLEFDADKDASVAVFYGSGGAFCAGWDLKYVSTLDAARLAKDRLGSYLVLGVLAAFTFQVIYNITMSAGLAPVKGITLPFMSYGGSSMIATLAGFGLVLNVRMRRFTN